MGDSKSQIPGNREIAGKQHFHYSWKLLPFLWFVNFRVEFLGQADLSTAEEKQQEEAAEKRKKVMSKKR